MFVVHLEEQLAVQWKRSFLAVGKVMLHLLYKQMLVKWGYFLWQACFEWGIIFSGYREMDYDHGEERFFHSDCGEPAEFSIKAANAISLIISEKEIGTFL